MGLEKGRKAEHRDDWHGYKDTETGRENRETEMETNKDRKGKRGNQIKHKETEKDK